MFGHSELVSSLTLSGEVERRGRERKRREAPEAMEELYQTFRTNCQCLMDGRGDVSSANEWFLSFVHEEPVMCWDFCAEVIAGAHLRYDEEQEEQEGRNEWESILVSNHLHESFFAVKLLLNVMQLPHQWREVSEEQGMHARQVCTV